MDKIKTNKLLKVSELKMQKWLYNVASIIWS